MSSGNLRWMGRLDMYRKVPTDLLEGTKRGSILSIVATLVMVTLFLLETNAYFRKTYVFIPLLTSPSINTLRFGCVLCSHSLPILTTLLPTL
jgi:Endoplasmic Reticulum-Golgi Intermediate Compartment (ERGIC)